jgi:hypothetical protein
MNRLYLSYLIAIIGIGCVGCVPTTTYHFQVVDAQTKEPIGYVNASTKRFFGI